MTQNTWRHALGRSVWQPQNQISTLVVLGIILTLIFAGIYLSQVASYATTNREIATLIEKRDRLERTNEQIRAEIANLETVPHLLARAQQLGFRLATADDIEYLVIDGYDPNRASNIVPLLNTDPVSNVPQYDETFSGWLQQQFDSLSRQFENFGRR